MYDEPRGRVFKTSMGTMKDEAWKMMQRARLVKILSESENRANNSNAIANFSSLYPIDYRIAE